jgi:hypothetical protein
MKESDSLDTADPSEAQTAESRLLEESNAALAGLVGMSPKQRFFNIYDLWNTICSSIFQN